MISYRDRTYCSAYGLSCGTDNCSRAVTDWVQERADAWWGKGPGKAPIAYSDLSEGCEWQTPCPASEPISENIPDNALTRFQPSANKLFALSPTS